MFSDTKRSLEFGLNDREDGEETSFFTAANI